MPLFEFHCRECEETFERLLRQPQDEAPCPLCGKPAKRKVSPFSATGSSGCSSPPGSGFT